VRNFVQSRILPLIFGSAAALLSSVSPARSLTFTTINDPSDVYGTQASGINTAGQIVGYYYGSGNLNGFLDTNGTFTTINDPSGVDLTQANGINTAGQIVGYYYDSSGNLNGFLDTNGTFTTINDPSGVNGTQANGINTAGQIVGSYTDSSGNFNGFLATQDTPAVPFDVPGGATIPTLGTVLAIGVMRKIRKSISNNLSKPKIKKVN